jgi:O-antigen/teichoic acid export membrane protein
MLLQTIFTKGAGTVGQIIVAWFLSPHDFKLVGLAYLVTSFPNLIRDAGLQGILAQRQRFLRRWLEPVFWLSLSLGVAAFLIMVVAAPISARVFAQPQLTGLITVIAVGSLFGSLGTVPAALVLVHLRFRFQALLGLFSALFVQILSIILAWRGFGAYSYIIPNALCTMLTSAIYWYTAPAKIHWRPYFNRWRGLVGDSGALLVINLLAMLVTQGDYFFLGIFHKHDDATGIFYFSFNLSWQMLVLLTANVGSVLYPTMVKLLHDPPRQMQAFLRSMRVLALVCVPGCLLQAALTNSGIHLVFKPKWYPAIPVVEVLCIGMAIRCVGITAMAVNLTRGRYHLQAVISAVYSIIFLLTMAVAAKLGGALAVAVAEAGFYLIVDPINLGLILKLNGEQPVRQLLRIYGVPLIAGAFAAGLAYTAALALPAFHGDNLARILLVTLLTASIYLPLIRKFAPADWKDVLSLRRSRSAA